MSKEMLKPADIAAIVGSNLNELSQLLYDNGDIHQKIVFHATADYQEYERMQKAEYSIDEYEEFTPLIISRVDHVQYPANYLRYEETYSMMVYGYADQAHSLETIFKQYTVIESTTNKAIELDGYRVSKVATYDMNFGEEEFPSDGTDRMRIYGTDGGFTWNFLDGIKSSYDIEIKIDDVVMPYIDYSFIDASRLIGSEPTSKEGSDKKLNSSRFYGIELVIPYVKSIPKVVEIYNDFYSGVYNKTHTISYNDGDVSFEYDVIVQEKRFSDSFPQTLEFGITLVRAEAPTIITIDNEIMPITNFDLTPETQLSTTVNINEDRAKSTHLSSSYTITVELDVSDLTNPVVQDFMARTLNIDFGSNHKLVIQKGPIGKIYDVIFQLGTYAFDTNPNDTIVLTFTEIDGEV